MKSRRRHVPRDVEAPFAYTLMGNIDIHNDELLNFSGKKESTERDEITEFLQNKSFAPGLETLTKRNSYLQFEAPEEELKGSNRKAPNEGGRNFVALGDETQHLWFISQQCSGATPFARNFSTADQFFQYVAQRSLVLPSAPLGSAGMELPTMQTRTVETEETSGSERENTVASETPAMAAKWLDIQTTNKNFVKEILSHFTLSQDTIDHCCYLDTVDRLISHSTLGYYFFNLMCTPITPDDKINSPRRAKSVIQLRLDASMQDHPRASIPAPVSLAVILFHDWIITVHEKPFHEFDDLLKFVHVNCGVYDSYRDMQHRTQVMTPPFIFSSLLQIVVGHQLDTVSLIKTIDKIGDTVFHVEEEKEERDKALQRITNVRRCLAECANELSRREHIVSVLLQPHMADSFLTRERVVCRQLESAQAHLLRLSDELSDCRDTVSVTNWYHNVARTWQLLRRGNRALRQTLLLTEMTNIMYPVIAIQTVYAVNVEVPFDSEAEIPTENLTAFFVMMGVVLVYLLLCGRAVYALIHRKRWDTKLLAR